MDDDADVRGCARRVLEKAGFTLVEAADGQEATERAAASPTSIGLVLTDAVMPPCTVRSWPSARLCATAAGNDAVGSAASPRSL